MVLATLSLNGLVSGFSPLLAHQSFEVGKCSLLLRLCLARLNGSACKKNSSAHIYFSFVHFFYLFAVGKLFQGPWEKWD